MYLNAYSTEAKRRAELIDLIYRTSGKNADIWEITRAVDNLLKNPE